MAWPRQRRGNSADVRGERERRREGGRWGEGGADGRGPVEHGEGGGLRGEGGGLLEGGKMTGASAN